MQIKGLLFANNLFASYLSQRSTKCVPANGFKNFRKLTNILKNLCRVNLNNIYLITHAAVITLKYFTFEDKLTFIKVTSANKLEVNRFLPPDKIGHRFHS